jgi:superfamily I DNA/RNA helicase
MVEVVKIRGLPGTGKTTHLGKILEDILEEDEMGAILFTSFSRATMEAIESKMEGIGYSREELRDSFRTLHSFAARALELRKGEDFVQSQDYIKFAFDNGIDFRPFRVRTIDEIDAFGITGEEYIPVEGNLLFAWWQFLKNKYIESERVKEAILQRRDLSVDAEKILKNYSNTDLYYLFMEWEKEKSKKGRYEYNDMLQEVLEEGISYRSGIKYVIVDEAQDLSPLQYEIINLWARDSEKLYFAFDSLQTLYFFNAADPSLVEDIKGTEKVLPRSYRVPRIPWSYARRVAHYIGDNTIDQVEPADREGFVAYLDFDAVIDTIDGDKKTFFLFRTHYAADSFINLCMKQDIYLRGIGRIATCFNSQTFCALYDLILKLYTGEPLTDMEIKLFILSIPAKYLRRGEKTKVKREGIDTTQQKLYDQDTHSRFYSYFRSADDVDSIKEILLDPKTRLSDLKRNILVGIDRSSNRIMRDCLVGTYFAAKGLEADQVYLFDYFPRLGANIRRDEARLVFTGLTRTKDGIYIVSPRDYYEKGLVYDLAIGG